MLRLAAGLVVSAALSASALASSDATVQIRNDSLWTIHHLFISATSTQEWGPDQLGDAVIESEGGEFTLTDIPCGAYDVRLVDEDGDECVVGDVGLCAGEGSWVITDEDLLACQNATE
jgi:hypothetical protein